uniref:Dehydrogenase/reductase (SDR family) member 13b.2 n=1 Tax=Cynoglossus semilaevis TaxID=244447 RepID=A0A3P8V454_CYNSE
MRVVFKTLVSLYVCTGVLCVHQLSWLPCMFIDERVSLNDKGVPEIQQIPREAFLQFGQKEDAAVNPQVITFMVTGSRLDLRRYVDVWEAEQLECQLYRYSTHGSYVRWPGKGNQEYNHWFRFTIKPSNGLSVTSGFLRRPSDQPAPEKQDFFNWTTIADREVLTTTVAVVIKSQTPFVRTGLRSQPKLHCQFALDHKSPNFILEWILQRRGERTTVFSYNSRSGQTEGTGVGLKALEDGDASYSLAFTKTISEGLYICSLSVNPLSIQMNMDLHVEEPPRVSINIQPDLLLQKGEEQKVVCEAVGYYPLDVEIVWHEQEPSASGQRVGTSLPKKTSLRNLGQSQFICSVSHKSLRVPIKKSFTLTVEEPSSWLFSITMGFIVLALLFVLCVMLLYLSSVRKKIHEKKPY